MGLALLAGGIVGSALGVGVFAILHQLAQLDVVIKISYVLFLSGIGLLMLRESLQAMLRSRTPGGQAARASHLDRRAAAEDALPPLAALHQRAAAGRGRAAGRRAGGDHGRRRRLHHGAGDDLPARHAVDGGGRNVAVSDHLRHRHRHHPAGDHHADGRRRAGGAADRRQRHRRAVRRPRRHPAARRSASRSAGGAGARRRRQARLRSDRDARRSVIPSADCRRRDEPPPSPGRRVRLRDRRAGVRAGQGGAGGGALQPSGGDHAPASAGPTFCCSARRTAPAT